MNQNLLFISAIIGITFPLTARAQCAPTVQQLITERKLDEARAEVGAQLNRSPRDDAAMERRCQDSNRVSYPGVK